MITGSLGLRSSGSYGSLPVPQFQIGYSLPNQPSPPVSSRKPPKMFKEKDRMFHWISRFAPRKKLGMLLLGAISAVVFIWVLYYDKEGGVQQGNIDIQFNSSFGNGGYSPISVKIRSKQDNVSLDGNNGESGSIVVELPQSLPPPSPVLPAYFKGYTLPPGNPCEHFTLPPPPADPKRTGPRPCPVCYLPIEQVLDLMPSAPSFSPILKNLTYIHEDKLTKTEFGGSEFGGYPSLSQRNDSYDIKESMSVHCGFVRGVKPGRGTGFDINDLDLVEMESCQGVVVASAIFGAFDVLHQPQNVSDYANRTVCFYMFVDEETESFLKNSIALDESKKIGLWRIVVVHNLPFSDPRRNGKVPKLLLHRLFPNARYSLWIDGKLKLVVDPYQVLERFLWRKNSSFAISRHYRRFDVFVEAEANKAAGKYENDSIDFQIEFYKKEGLTPYSSAKLPITSDVPEGCVIIKEHIPITNLFTCLWFNEVDRFTSRDQISFSTVRDKIWSVTNWTLNMFLDCERRNFVVQDYHRDLLEHMAHPPPPPPLVVTTASRDEILKNTTAEISTGIILDDPTRIILDDPTKKTSPRRGKDRKSKRHRKVVAGSKGIG